MGTVIVIALVLAWAVMILLHVANQSRINRMDAELAQQAAQIKDFSTQVSTLYSKVSHFSTEIKSAVASSQSENAKMLLESSPCRCQEVVEPLNRSMGQLSSDMASKLLSGKAQSEILRAKVDEANNKLRDMQKRVDSLERLRTVNETPHEYRHEDYIPTDKSRTLNTERSDGDEILEFYNRKNLTT